MTPARRAFTADLLIAAGLFAAQLPSVIGWPGPARSLTPVSLILVALQTWPVVFRRRAPVLVLAVTVAAYGFHTSIGVAYISPFFAPVALYAVAAYAETRVALAAGVLGFAAVLGGTALEVTDHRAGIADMIFIGTVISIAWTVGYRVRAARTRVQRLANRAAALEAEREGAARQAAEVERARIARELHDVIAHGVGVMVVQAAGARRVLDRDPAAAAEALAAIEGAGRTALTELRRLLGILRDDEPASLEPLPGIGSIETLAAQMQRAGLAVDVTSEGPSRELPAGVALSVYRIAQEALTNTLKHARASRADVVLRYEQAAIVVSVRDDGDAAAAAAAGGAGHGLVGMRERVALFGGTIAAGPHPEGGFAVEARLPLPEEAP